MREERIVRLISSVLDGELSPARSAFVIRKIETDSFWKEKYEELKGIKGLLSGVSSAEKLVELSPDFDFKLREKLATDRNKDKARGGFISSILSFFERRTGQLAYALVGSSLVFIIYVGFEVYSKFSPVSSPSSSASSKSMSGLEASSVADDGFTTVIKSNGELFVNKDSSRVIIDIYSGEVKGDLDEGSKVLLRNVISNIDVYRKIYSDHYKPSKDFKRVSVPVYEASGN